MDYLELKHHGIKDQQWGKSTAETLAPILGAYGGLKLISSASNNSDVSDKEIEKMKKK